MRAQARLVVFRHVGSISGSVLGPFTKSSFSKLCSTFEQGCEYVHLLPKALVDTDGLNSYFLFIYPSEQELKMFSILPSELGKRQLVQAGLIFEKEQPDDKRYVFNFLVNFFAKEIEKPSKGERVLSSVKADGRTEISCYEARNRKA
ncbi:hypothetical protein T02_16171 [Trichinella nativa]|uniref:Uncharacterized protein n=1 Tax=Trichinella nativa TaxID=6335 RepID=A0A0V1KQL1_9BILA|nr:hypothetical protein T02_16171 [Trichinella nativa]